MKIFLVGLITVGYLLKKSWPQIRYFIKGNEIRIEIEDRIKAGHWNLSKAEINDFTNVYNNQFIAEKILEWQDLCESKKGYHCRLLSHYHEVKGNDPLAISFALIGCENKDAHSCVAAYKNNDFDLKHPKYYEVLDAIISVCDSDKAISEIDQYACDIYKK